MEPSLTRSDAAGHPTALVLMLHGGQPRSTEPVGARSTSWLRTRAMQRAIAPGAHQAGTSVWSLRYRTRGWNAGTDVVADARWALDRVRAAYGVDLPVVLLGHSMGARVAVHAADDRSVVGVVGLAPWWSPEDPVHTLAGRSLEAAHGRRDRITSFRATSQYVERARAVARSAQLRDMGPAGHYMLTGVDAWNDVALSSALAMLADARRAPD